MNVYSTVLLIFPLFFSDSQQRRYDNYALYQVMPIRLQHLTFLQNLEKRKYLDVYFWRKPCALYHEVQFIANNNDTQDLVERMNHFALPCEVLATNVQKEFDEQTASLLRSQSFSWDNYQSLENINRWIYNISVKYPHMVNVESIGKSAQNRNIFAVAIKTNKDKVKPKVIVEAGIHGHEWISPMFATYIINGLTHVAKDHDDKRIAELASAYDWYIIPVANPDGFKYNQDEDRLWRKNRNTCRDHIGVDLNKNFNYSFGLHDASTDPENDYYCGPMPFSEPETLAIANFISNCSKGNGLGFYFSIHSYGQMIILPYSDKIQLGEDIHAMENFAKQAIIKMFRFSGNKYYVGTNYDTLGRRGSGDSVSWVQKNIQPRFAATFVLRDRGRKGYALPPSEILVTCKESMIGLIEMMTAKPKLLGITMFNTRANNGAATFVPNFALFAVSILFN